MDALFYEYHASLVCLPYALSHTVTCFLSYAAAPANNAFMMRVQHYCSHVPCVLQVTSQFADVWVEIYSP